MSHKLGLPSSPTLLPKGEGGSILSPSLRGPTVYTQVRI